MPFLLFNVTPDAVSNNKLPADEVWKKSNSPPIGHATDAVVNIEHVISPPTLKYCKRWEY